ncbi:MAG: nucleoside hydrolase-like domain-containing protein [Planctomycetota bacterium]
MKPTFQRIAIALMVGCLFANVTSAKTRLIVMADMGNEPDEEQQMAHLLMYANELDLEGLIACSGKYLHADRTDGRTKVRPDLFHNLVDGYSGVVENLRQHATGWPSPDALRRIIKAGTSDYGIAAVKPGRSNEASKLIEASILSDDPRKLYIVGNAGTNTLAQTLVDLHETRSNEEMEALCDRIIVFENGAQDNSGAWIAERYPNIAWHRSNHQTYGYGGPGRGESIQGPYTWEPFERTADGQNDWVTEHISTKHGSLGERFPPRIMGGRLHFLEGGGTIPWMGLVNVGLTNPERLDWGGWSGRFSSTRHKNILSRHQDIRKDELQYGEFRMFEADSEPETWVDPVHGEEFTGRYVPVWRFRRAMFNEFRARMDWCVKDYDEANHSPVASFNGDTGDKIVLRNVSAGQTIRLDASSSTDPDGDELEVHWWIYHEAGTYSGPLTLKEPTSNVTELTVPTDAAGKEIHVVLEVRDRSVVVPLTDYRRIVVTVTDQNTGT